MISKGLFIARARRDIHEGEELTLNHGPHYKDAPREERREYLKKIYINCDCIECGRIDDHWVIIIHYAHFITKCCYCRITYLPDSLPARQVRGLSVQRERPPNLSEMLAKQRGSRRGASADRAVAGHRVVSIERSFGAAVARCVVSFRAPADDDSA